MHLILEMNYFGYPKFSTLPPLNMNDKLFFCKNLTLNILVIEAKDVPAMDRNGFSDPFIKLYLLGPKQNDKIGEVKTKIIKKTLNPVWNEEYHFPIKSIGTDVLHMSFKDYNTLGRDDPISKYDLYMKNLIPGKVYDEWISFLPDKNVPKGGQIHLKYHLALPGSYAFVDNPKETLTFHINVIEAKEVKSMDLNGFSDPYCQMQIIGDRTYQRTDIKYETLSPYWDQTFKFLITNYETDIFNLLLRDKDKISDDDIGFINLQINQFEIGKVYKKWVEVQHKGKKTGLVRVRINVNRTNEEPFLGPLIEEKPVFVPNPLWEINIHLKNATNLPSADSNGLSDPYCLFTILNTKTSIKSRRIDKCLNPKWDEYFHIPINSLNSDILRLEVIDWDKIGKDDKLCMIDFPLSTFEFGKIYNDIYSLTPLEGRSGGSKIELSFQITPPSVVPFTEIIYIPDQLNVRLEDISNIVLKKPLKNPKLFFNLKLEKDTNTGIKSPIKEQLNTELKEEFYFIITNQQTDRLILEYKNEADKNKTISKCIISLNDLQKDKTKELKVEMDPVGIIHLYLQINKKNEEPFQDMKFVASSNPYMTLYIKVLSGSKIPVSDESGLSDPFCVLELLNRKDQRKTEIKKQTLNPIWNQEFQFKILSYNTDVFSLSLYDYDKYSKNDLLGKWTMNLINIKPGIVYDENINAGGTIHVNYHLAMPNQAKWESCEYLPLILNVKVIEAKDLPITDASGSCDGYCKIQFGKQKAQTRTIDNSLTPKWRQQFSFEILDFQEDFLFIQLYDHDSVGKDDLISDLEIHPRTLQPGIIIDQWYTMRRIIKKSSPQIHLIIHLSQEKDTPFVQCPFQILVTNIRVISVKDIPLGEYTVSVGYKENFMKETRKTNDLLWQEEFCLAMPLDEPVLKINLNKNKNIIAKTNVFIGFQVEEIVKNWYPMKPNGNIKLALQVAPNYVEPFLNEKFEDFPPANELFLLFSFLLLELILL